LGGNLLHERKGSIASVVLEFDNSARCGERGANQGSEGEGKEKVCNPSLHAVQRCCVVCLGACSWCVPLFGESRHRVFCAPPPNFLEEEEKKKK
jgi:hypothetical protein